jgi:hopanoid biosynthesis associated protein HpnK
VTRRLIVTGDDFGARPGVNAAIARAHREGILTTASLMVTGDALDEAVELARAMPGLSTGLHLVLCDARPVSAPETIPDLVTAEGRLPRAPGPTGVAHALLWPRRRAQIEREIRAQFEAYLATGLPLHHLDGHHHLHMHPFVFGILERCFEDYKVSWVRLVEEQGRTARRGGESWLGEGIAWAFGALARRHRASLARRGAVRAPDALHGLRASGAMDRAEWLRALPHLDGATVEVYTHPDTEGPGRAELEALCDPEVREAVEAAGFTIVGTRQLAHGEVGEA